MSRWDGLVPWYKRHEQFSLQSTVTCLAMTESCNAGAILEVGCGPGLHSEFIARNYLKEGGVLVSCDFSKEMVVAMKDRYSESDFTKQPGNVVKLTMLVTAALLFKSRDPVTVPELEDKFSAVALIT